MTNWAGNIIFRAARFHQPESIEELRRIIGRSTSCRVVGTAHSFNRIADTPNDLVSLRALPERIVIDRSAQTVTVSAGTSYGTLAAELHSGAMALANLGSLPHISVGGACSTGTHGSGDSNGNLSTAVRAIELLTADGDLVTVDREADAGIFPGAVISLGSLGVVTALTLDVEPTYDVSQTVYEHIPFDDGLHDLDNILGSGYSVSIFTQWDRPVFDQVWVKRQIAPIEPTDVPDVPDVLRRASIATRQRHPLPLHSGDVCTTQMGVTGPWHQRLPHFRLDFSPSAGDELQSEYFVDRAFAVPALHALNELRAHIAPHLLVSELRTVAADDLWLSPAYGRNSLAIHFTWKPDAAAIAPVLQVIEERLSTFSVRPHWGKVFAFDDDYVVGQYPHIAAATHLAMHFDPTAKFENEFTKAYLRR